MKSIHGGDIYRNQVEIDFSVNINPLSRPKEIDLALHKAVKRCHEYPDIEAAKLKEALSNKLSISKDYLLFGNGASELLMGVMHAIKPSKVCLPVPSFYGYDYAINAIESSIRYFFLKEEDEFTFTEDFFKVLTEDIEMLILTNPNNPTGKRIDKTYLKRVLEICKEKKIFVLLDECFIEFCGHHFSMISEIENYKNLLIIRAFTKSYAIPGVRSGYLISSHLDLLKKIKGQLPEWNLSTFVQEAGIACLKQTDYILKTVDYVKKERQFLLEGLKKLGLRVISSDANFILIYSKTLLYEKLLQKGILIRDCKNFRGLTEGYYRIAVKQRKENEKLLKVIGECLE